MVEYLWSSEKYTLKLSLRQGRHPQGALILSNHPGGHAGGGRFRVVRVRVIVNYIINFLSISYVMS